MFSGCETFNQPLDNWEVGKVTNMVMLFNECTLFNQQLNNWNVSNVTDMSRMFNDCTSFNQPLNNWIVSNVTNMSSMFEGCTSFNQPLIAWDVTSLRGHHSNMFNHCSITEENKPIFTAVRRTGIDPNQIHKESNKINYVKLNSFLKEKSHAADVPADLDFPTYINTVLTKIINESDETEEKKKEQTSDLNRIMTNRLNGVGFSELSPKVRDSIYYSLEYLKQQPDDFKKIYVFTYIQECVRAYDGPDGMTCAMGALERIVNSFVKPCISSVSEGKKNDEYEKLVAIIAANPQILIPEYILDWYRLHKKGTDGEFKAGTTEDEKKADLKSYLMDKFPENGGLVNEKIAEIADNIGYDDDDFMFGGKRRKTKKNRKKTNRKTNRKINKKSNRKTNRNKKIMI
jgi:surface protein